MQQQLLDEVARYLFATLVIALAVIALAKVWPLAIGTASWQWWGIGIAVAVGVASAGAAMIHRRPSDLHAAMELDGRGQLQERIASAITLEPDHLSTPAGQALLQDAARHAERVEVAGFFPPQRHWKHALPLIPLILSLLLAACVPDATPRATADAMASPANEQVRHSAAALRRHLRENRQKAEDQDLPDASRLLSEMEEKLDPLTKPHAVGRREAAVRLNQLSDEIEKRRSELGNATQLRDRLKHLKELAAGPIGKIAEALRQGAAGEAANQLRQLQQRIQKGELTSDQQKRMAQDMQKLAERLSASVRQQAQAKQQLQREIERLQAAGDHVQAGRLRDQLQRLQAADRTIQQLQQMAANLSSCSECLNSGKANDASAQLDQLTQNLQQMQQAMNELQLLDNALQQLMAAKDSMQCQQCNGMGCTSCQGTDSLAGTGMGEGLGRGQRPEAESGGRFYESQVRADVRKGRSVVTGFAGGPNATGDVLTQIQSALESGDLRQADPVGEARIPRTHRDHARQYFDSLRDDE